MDYLTIGELLAISGYPELGASPVVQSYRFSLKCRRYKFKPWVTKIPWRKTQQPTPVFLPGEFHIRGYSLWGLKEVDMTEQLTLALFTLLENHLF